jgi:hypothetical protein
MVNRSVHYYAREDMTLIQLTAPPDGVYRLEGRVTILDRDREDA